MDQNKKEHHSGLEETWENFEASYHDKMGELEQHWKHTDVRIRKFVEKNPLLVVGVAVGLGFLVGRILSRK